MLGTIRETQGPGRIQLWKRRANQTWLRDRHMVMAHGQGAGSVSLWGKIQCDSTDAPLPHSAMVAGWLTALLLTRFPSRQPHAVDSADPVWCVALV